MARKLAICNQKGGVGKTTTAINLSAGLALAGRKTLLVDLDPQANATSGLSRERSKRHGVGQALTIPSEASECLTTTAFELLDLIPSHASLISVEQSLVKLQDKEQRLKAALLPLEERYDYVIIDCPPSLGLLPLNALVYADRVIVPIQCEFFAMEGLGHITAAIQEARQELNPALQLEGVLFTMFDPGVELAEEVIAEVSKHFEDKVYPHPIPRDVTLPESASHGQSIYEYAIGSKGARGYIELTREVIANERQEARARV